MSDIRTRNTDNGDDKDRLVRARRENRARTVFISVIAAGIFSFVINALYDAHVYNRQVERARTNCELVQDVSDLLAQISRRVAKNAPNKEQRDLWIGYSQRFDNAVPPEAQSCSKVHPKRDVLPIIG
jgi:hypothetical protein